MQDIMMICQEWTPLYARRNTNHYRKSGTAIVSNNCVIFHSLITALTISMVYKIQYLMVIICNNTIVK